MTAPIPSTSPIFRNYDKFRYIIEEARTGEIVARDVYVEKPQLVRKLSGPCIMEFDIDYRHSSIQLPDNSGPILLKPWGHICHVETVVGGERVIFASAIMKPSDVDENTGVLHFQGEGFSNYAHEIPLLINWNPITVDPFTIVDKIWTHIQSFDNGNLNVQIYNFNEAGDELDPPLSNTQMFPGFSFDGTDFVVDFFAIFIRAVDYTDCGDYINSLARDIPFDYFEESRWNEGKTAINKRIQLAYPHGGVSQTNLVFRQNENILQMKTHTESEIQWASDIVGRGWFPGRTYSSQLSNIDDTRLRRVIMEDDVMINSNERSAIWADRQLTRRQEPHWWESIIISMYHSNAPWGSYDVGDQIRVQGFMPWVGWVDLVHKIIALAPDEENGIVQLALKAEGAFNYDPIFFAGPNTNLLTNYNFISDLDFWTDVGDGGWFRDPAVGNLSLGSARVEADGTLKTLMSEHITVHNDTDWIAGSASVKWHNGVSVDGSAPLLVGAIMYNEDDEVLYHPTFKSIAMPTNDSDGWQAIGGRWTIPSFAPDISYCRLLLVVQPSMTDGTVWYDDVNIKMDE